MIQDNLRRYPIRYPADAQRFGRVIEIIARDRDRPEYHTSGVRD